MRLFFFVGICAWAQIETPKIGTMLDRNGSVRPVFGVASSVTLGDSSADNIASIACGTRCFTSADPAVIAFDGDSTYVYSGGILTCDGEPVAIHVTGEILSMRVVEGTLQFAVRRDGGTWVVRDGDIAVGAIEGATGPVMLLDRAVLFAAGDETVLRREDGSETRFPIHADSFIAMGEGYVQIRSGESNYALGLKTRKLFQLPEVQ